MPAILIGALKTMEYIKESHLFKNIVDFIFGNADLLGVFGFIISLGNLLYSRPKIKITSFKLEIKKHSHDFLISNKDSTLEKLKNFGVAFQLSIKIINKKNGPGSIEVPKLFFKIKNRNPFKKVEEMAINESGNDFNGSFHIKGGEILNTIIEYRATCNVKEDVLYKLAKNYENGSFYISYMTNSNKKYRKRINLEIDSY